MHEADLVIAGAGPAGLSTALHLVRDAPALAAGTVILERAPHPRPKTCAGGVLADGLEVLRRLGLRLADVPGQEVRRADFRIAGTTVTWRRRPWDFRVVDRSVLDAWLADRVRRRGVALHEGVTVQAVEPASDGVVVHTDRGAWHARAVVGADGATGVVQRAVTADGAPQQLGRALMVSWGGPSERQADEAFFDYDIRRAGVQGYVWDFPAPPGGSAARTLGIFDMGLHGGSPRPRLRPLLEDVIRRHGGDPASLSFQGGVVRWYHPRVPITRPRVLLVGDAAGVDGWFGEGITVALGHGAAAARTLAEAADTGDWSFRHHAAELRRSPLGRVLDFRLGMAAIMFHPRLRAPGDALFRPARPAWEALLHHCVFDWARAVDEDEAAAGGKRSPPRARRAFFEHVARWSGGDSDRRRRAG